MQANHVKWLWSEKIMLIIINSFPDSSFISLGNAFAFKTYSRPVIS